MITKSKKPSLKEKVETYEAFLHRINFHRSITMDEKAVAKLLELVDSWSYSHRRGNGEAEKEMNERINFEFDRIRLAAKPHINT